MSINANTPSYLAKKSTITLSACASPANENLLANSIPCELSEAPRKGFSVTNGVEVNSVNHSHVNNRIAATPNIEHADFLDPVNSSSDETFGLRNLSSEDTFPTFHDFCVREEIVYQTSDRLGRETEVVSSQDISVSLAPEPVTQPKRSQPEIVDLTSAESFAQLLRGNEDLFSSNSPRLTEDIVTVLDLSGAEDLQPQHIEVVSVEESLSEEESQRLQREREERESQELIWQLMRQEQMDLYEMQLQYMQNVTEGLSEEDRRALEEAMQENNQLVQNIQSYEEAEEEEEEVEEGEEDEENWDYERLLELGQALGDVKTERWRTRSKQIIDSLPVLCYKNLQSGAADAFKADQQQTKRTRVEEGSPSPAVVCVLPSMSSTKSLYQDFRCVVCMEDFEQTDEVRLLPCTHYFHLTCAAGWLQDHNSCPTCKKKVVMSPEK